MLYQPKGIAFLYDPLGILNPVVLKLKLLFQQACQSIASWDDLLNDKLLSEWILIEKDFRDSLVLQIGLS